MTTSPAPPGPPDEAGRCRIEEAAGAAASGRKAADDDEPGASRAVRAR